MPSINIFGTLVWDLCRFQNPKCSRLSHKCIIYKSILKTSLITYNTKHSVNALSIVTMLYCSGNNNQRKPSTWSKQFNCVFLGVSCVLGWSFSPCAVSAVSAGVLELLILLTPRPEGDYGYGPPCFLQYWGSNLGHQACSTDTPPTKLPLPPWCT